MYCYDETPIGTCGISVFSDYSIKRHNIWGDAQNKVPIKHHGGGCGWVLTGFIDNKKCKQMYKYMHKHAKLVYQSPVRENNNSGNDFFFCIWDTR